MTLKPSFKLHDGEIYKVVGNYWHWMTPGEAATAYRYDGLLTPDERAELAAVISQYHEQFQAQKVA